MPLHDHRAIEPVAPSEDRLTDYDRAHRITYLRLLDADADGAEWREVSQVVLGLDIDRDPDAARTTWESHLARARWMTTAGYRHELDDTSRSSSS